MASKTQILFFSLAKKYLAREEYFITEHQINSTSFINYNLSSNI